jgi:hypothetical protein
MIMQILARSKRRTDFKPGVATVQEDQEGRVQARVQELFMFDPIKSFHPKSRGCGIPPVELEHREARGTP